MTPLKKGFKLQRLTRFFWGGGEALFVHEVCVLFLFGSFGRSEVKEFVGMIGAPHFPKMLSYAMVTGGDDGWMNLSGCEADNMTDMLGWKNRRRLQLTHEFLGGGFKDFYFHPENWERFPFWLIFFKWVETTK